MSMHCGDYDLIIFNRKEKELYGLYKCGDLIFMLNSLPTQPQLEEIVRAYELGVSAGEQIGRSNLQFEFKKLMNL